MDREPVFLLSVHEPYRCGHTGICCRTGWAIAVDRERHDRVRQAIGAGRLRLSAGGHAGASPFVSAPEPPPGSAAVLATTRDGACVFHDRHASRCVIHRDLDHDALPVACQQFPRVGLRDRRGLFVSLSHYCPTAARLLLRHGDPLRVVSPADARSCDGLEARDALPPLLRPGLLMDWTDYTRWEHAAIDALADTSTSLQASLLGLVDVVERMRSWRPASGTPLSHLIGCDSTATAGVVPEDAAPDTGTLVAALCAARDDARAAVPAGLVPDAPAHPSAGDMCRVWERLAGHEPVARRYLAARLFGSWLAYHGRGLRTVLAGMLVAWAVLQIEVAHVMGNAGGRLSEDGLVRALGRADYLLVHLVDVRAFAKQLAPVERPGGQGRLRQLALTGAASGTVR